MQVLFINNDGGGFADYVDVADGTTVDVFFDRQLPDRDPDDYLIRVNRQPVPSDQALQEGDRVTMTPTKIDGSSLARRHMLCKVGRPRFSRPWLPLLHRSQHT